MQTGLVAQTDEESLVQGKAADEAPLSSLGLVDRRGNLHNQPFPRRTPEGQRDVGGLAWPPEGALAILGQHNSIRVNDRHQVEQRVAARLLHELLQARDVPGAQALGQEWAIRQET